MANRKNPRGRRPHRVPVPARPVQRADAADLELFRTLRGALRSDLPLDLLAVVSGFVNVADPRSRDPFVDEESPAGLADLVESFIATPYAETTAALTVLRTLVPDELMAARIARELDTRRHPMPDWLRTFAGSRVEPDVWLLTHVLGDGDDYLIGANLPSGQALSALIYVDHNLGTVVKDAFMLPEPLEDLAMKVGTTIDDPDQSLTRTEAATARAVIERAIDHGSRLYPPPESDSWPMCRPLVEWMLRQLPTGGIAPESKEWSDEEIAAIAKDFFRSSFGIPFDRKDERDVLDSVLWFGTSYATADPLQWSPVTVELLLADWFPRKVVAHASYLAKLPDLLRAYIRYCHDQRGIRAVLTAETLAAVDHYEPEYQRTIRSARPQGPTALLAAMYDTRAAVAADDEDKDKDKDKDEPTLGEIMLEGLDRKVGGRIQLQNLDDEPLPDEPFEWAGIAADIRPVVQEILDTCDRCADELLDVEHRTAMRRFLSRAAAGDPAVFRRRASPVRAAAAIAWVTCRANDTVGAYWSGLRVQDLLAWFGVRGSVSPRADPLLRANGVDPHRLYGTMALGAADLLTSNRRGEIIAQRDRRRNDPDRQGPR